MSVKLFKLSCGDLIIAEVEDAADRDNDYLLIFKPLRMLITDKGIALQMWCPCDLDQPTVVSRAHIVTESIAVAPLAQEYKAKFGGSIIQVEEKSLVIPG